MPRIIKHANIFYIPNLNVIGGTEQFVFEIVRKYNEYDIGVVYKNGDINQVNRIKSYAKIYKVDNFRNYRFVCNKLFCNYATDIVNYTDAKDYVQIIHAMYKTNGISPVKEPKINKYFAVSNIAQKEYIELTNKEVGIFRNPLTFTDHDKKPALLLISATRLTREKGKDRMKTLIKLLDEGGYNWLWLIFTNDQNVIRHPNVSYMSPRLDIRPYIHLAKGYGYGVQLSDCEGDCYFTRECEALGVPLLVTPIPSLKEQNLVEGKNCYYLPFDMKISSKKLDKIVNEIPIYEPYIREDHWDELLDKECLFNENNDNLDYTNDNGLIKVKALPIYRQKRIVDNELGRIPKTNETWEVTPERLSVLLGNNAWGVPLVVIIDD